MASIRQIPSGLFQARVRRRGFKTVSRAFHEREDAEQWAKYIENRQARSAMTVGELLREYALTNPRQSETNVYAIKALDKALGSLNLEDLDKAALVAWRDNRLLSKSFSTVNRELAALGAAMKWGHLEREIYLPHGNLATCIGRQPLVLRNRRLDGNEFTRLIESFQNRAGAVNGAKRSGAYRVGTRNPWIRPLVELALETAMQKCELLSMRWSDVDLGVPCVHLEPRDGETTFPARTVPLSVRAVEILASVRNIPDRVDAERVFDTTSEAVKLAWKRACKRAGIGNLHFHDLRHEAISRLAAKLNVMELMAMTGHKDFVMLARYYPDGFCTKSATTLAMEMDGLPPDPP